MFPSRNRYFFFVLTHTLALPRSHPYNPKQTQLTMAWRCSGVSNQDLISRMVQAKLILTPSVKSAMLAVDRGHYSRFKPYEVLGVLFSTECKSPFFLAHSFVFKKPELIKQYLDTTRIRRRQSDTTRRSRRHICTLLPSRVLRRFSSLVPKVSYICVLQIFAPVERCN
jgi:hypothetical protein